MSHVAENPEGIGEDVILMPTRNSDRRTGEGKPHTSRARLGRARSQSHVLVSLLDTRGQPMREKPQCLSQG